jgi:hypothetical protein
LRERQDADDAPGEEIDDGSHIQPALGRPDIREVCNPFAVGSRGVLTGYNLLKRGDIPFNVEKLRAHIVRFEQVTGHKGKMSIVAQCIALEPLQYQ